HLPLMQIQKIAPVLRADGKLPSECLVHEHAESVDVRTRLDVCTDALLWRHVFRRPERISRLRQRLRCGQLAHTEIEDLRGAVLAEKYVSRFEIAVDNSFFVRRCESAAHANEYRYRKTWRQEALSRHLVREGASDEPLHDNVDGSVRHLIEIEHAYDVGM